MKLAGIALIFSLIPAMALACRTPPNQIGDFQRDSTVRLPGCSGQWGTECGATGIHGAWYSEPTDRYAHGVLGDAIEAAELNVYSNSAGADTCGRKRVRLDYDHVFEDIAPRLADIDGDGRAEVIAVRSHRRLGAQLSIWSDAGPDNELTLIAATPYIGTPYRWLAPVAAADLDGDGHVEIAYVDRPHLLRTLRIWRFRDGELVHLADKGGLTNHRIGEDFISGGLRTCAGRAELLTANADWTRIMASHLDDRIVRTRDVGPFTGAESMAAALHCR